MNERIKKLITEADAYAWSVDNKYVTRDCCHNGEVNYLWEDAFREKFAELIVRECACIATDCNSDMTAAEVLKHFGVEP